jgi:hypothetical protein
MVNAIQFLPPTQPVQLAALFVRLGESGYNKLANLDAAGRLPATRTKGNGNRKAETK